MAKLCLLYKLWKATIMMFLPLSSNQFAETILFHIETVRLRDTNQTSNVYGVGT